MTTISKNQAQTKAAELRNAADNANEKISDLAYRAGETVREFVTDRRDQAVQAADEVADRIRANPLRSSLIALGVGYLFGRFISR